MIPPNALANIKHGEPVNHGERDDLLDDLGLRGGINRVAPAIGWNHEKIFKEGDAPVRENEEGERLVLELQMAVSRERHEHVRAGQQRDGKPAGLDEVVHVLTSCRYNFQP